MSFDDMLIQPGKPRRKAGIAGPVSRVDRAGTITGKMTRAEELRLQLADEIVRGVLPPGTSLDETDLAQRFNVSRTPVREALRQLTASGLVDSRAHRGAVVAQPSSIASPACSRRWPSSKRYVPVSPPNGCRPYSVTRWRPSTKSCGC
jgi:DNA-binding transcriptional MocR family regulator